eukprot:54285_1
MTTKKTDVSCFRINQKVDFLKEYWKCAKITAIDDSGITIQYDTSWSKETETIDFNSNRFAPLHTYTIKHESLKPLARSYAYDYPYIKPIYYEKNNKKYLLLSTGTRSGKDVNGLYLYDIAINEWTLLSKYPINSESKIALKRHSQALDTRNNLLYLFGGIHNCFTVYNLNKHEWTTKVGTLNNKKGAKEYKLLNLVDVNALYLASPVNELHITTGNCQVKYDKMKNKFVDVAVIDNIESDKIKMVYYECEKK